VEAERGHIQIADTQHCAERRKLFQTRAAGKLDVPPNQEVEPLAGFHFNGLGDIALKQPGLTEQVADRAED
jgi:hypothetical protein